MNKKKSFKSRVVNGNALYTLIAIIIGFIIGAVMLLCIGINPLSAYGTMIYSVFNSPKNIVNGIMYGTPLIFTGLSVAFSFRTGVFNIGAEGQFVVGSIAAMLVGAFVDLPAILHIPLCFLAAMAAGALWGGFTGLLKVKKGINEVLTFIMLNWVAYYLNNLLVNVPGISGGSSSSSIKILKNAEIIFQNPVLHSINPRTNYGILVAIVVAVLIWFIINKTTLGYQLRAVGFNQNAARYGGINSDGAVMKAMAISGALAALGGAVQIMGNAFCISQFAGQEGYGFQGITVALIASSNPLGCIASGLFYGAIKFGGSRLTTIGAPREVLDIIMGAVVLIIAISSIFKNVIIRAIDKKGGK